MAMSEPNEPIAVTMPRAHWSAMLDYLTSTIIPKAEAGTATPDEINIVSRLACALISSGGSRMEHALVEHMLKDQSTNDTP